MIEARKFRWSDLESEEYPVYIGNLRAVECPEKTIKQIISADIHQLYARKLELPMDGDGFWMAASRRTLLEQEKNRREEALVEEKRALLLELLGSSIDSSELQENKRKEPEVDLILGFVSPGHGDRVMDAIERTQRDIASFKSSLDNILTPEDNAVVRARVEGLHAELASFLNPQEIQELNLRVAGLMKNSSERRIPLDGITGAEYREITRIEAQGNDVFTRVLNAESILSDEPEGKDDLIPEQLEAFLGAKKYAAYERAGDPRFREPYEIGQQFNLPAETSIQVYELRKLAEKEWTQASSAEDIPVDDVAEERRRVAAVARAGLGRILRGKPLEEYLKRDPFWFRISRDTQAGAPGGAVR